MALGTVAGLPVEAGLYTMALASLAYAAAGTSRALNVGTTTTLAIMTGAQVALYGPAAAGTLALLMALWLVVAGILRLGFVANFISEPVLIGFKGGIAVVIVLDQLPKLLNVTYPRGSFLQNVMGLIRALPEADGLALSVGLGSLALLVGLARLMPRAPAPLLAVAGSIVGSWAFHLQVPVVGALPAGLPRLVSPSPDLFGSLWGAALGMALMSFTESVAAARAFTRPSDPRLEPNRELVAVGVANAASGLFGGMGAGGGTSQTAVADGAGAESRLAGAVCGAITLVALLFLGPPLAFLPQSTLAAVVIATSVGLLKPADFRKVHRAGVREYRWALASFVGVIALGTLQGIIGAVVLSMLSLVAGTHDPPVFEIARKRGTDLFRPRESDDETFPGVILVRVLGTVYFANATRVADKVVALAQGSSTVVIECSGIPDFEYTGLKVLGELRSRLSGELWLVALSPRALELIRRLNPAGVRLAGNLTEVVSPAPAP